MNEEDILAKIISDLDAEFPSGVDIRTQGGDQQVDPPEIIIDWQTLDVEDDSQMEKTKVFANGGYGEGGFGDGGAGEGTLAGVARHEERRMQLTLLHRYTDELDALEQARTTETYFKQFEDTPTDFDSDTTEWDVGGISPSDTPFVEPDWYSVDLNVEFRYVKHYQDTEDFDILEDINIDIETTG